MPFEALFGDAIRLAEDGFPVHPRVGWDWARQEEALRADEGGARHYLVGRQGARHRHASSSAGAGRDLAAIARDGSKAFYEGPIAAEIAATVRRLGGFLSEADLAADAADWVEPISAATPATTCWRSRRTGRASPRSSCSGYCRWSALASDPDGAERYHLEIEAGRLAYSVRDHMVADPAAMTASPAELLSDSFIGELAARIDRQRRNPDISVPRLPKADTIYLTVVDRERPPSPSSTRPTTPSAPRS